MGKPQNPVSCSLSDFSSNTGELDTVTKFMPNASVIIWIFFKKNIPNLLNHKTAIFFRARTWIWNIRIREC